MLKVMGGNEALFAAATQVMHQGSVAPLIGLAASGHLKNESGDTLAPTFKGGYSFSFRLDPENANAAYITLRAQTPVSHLSTFLPSGEAKPLNIDPEHSAVSMEYRFRIEADPENRGQPLSQVRLLDDPVKIEVRYVEIES